jgi:PAS domain S-box-containing protein
MRRERLAVAVDQEFDFRIVRPDGAVRHIHNVSHPVVGADGVVATYVGTSVDVTERKLAEAAMRRSQDYLLEAQAMGRMGSWMWDEEAQEWSGSPELHRIYGLDSDEEPVTRKVMEDALHPDDGVLVGEAIETGVTTNSHFDVEHRIVRPDGSIRHLVTVGHPVFSEDGRLLEIVGMTMDVTERKQAEEALRQAYADLTRVSRITTMGELTASLAHEINQPIAAAVANANAALRWLAAATPDLDEARSTVEAIVDNARRAAEIVARTRKLFEKGEILREPIAIDEVVRETVMLLGGEAARESASIRLFLAGGAAEVEADRVQLQQVLMNLVLNAIDAVKEGDGRRELAVTSELAENNCQVMVSVSDTGVGLPVGGSDHLFETFFTTKPHGTGMGLSISRSIIAAHGGRLWAEANHPRGAVFRFALPVNGAAEQRVWGVISPS